MIHFQTRDNLMTWLATCCPRKAIVRALSQDGAENLGGFSSIPPADRPGWIVRVRSQFGRAWLVAVIPNERKTDYEIRILKQVPWDNWIGDEFGINRDAVRGDKPWLYKLLRYRGRKRCTSRKNTKTESER